jgi:hypothetical protein
MRALTKLCLIISIKHAAFAQNNSWIWEILKMLPFLSSEMRLISGARGLTLPIVP